MNTENLKEFIVLAETKNFWEASERLYMNQSTLSKHIKSLENDLGVALFTRTTRRVELTNYGEIFLPYAKSVTRSEFEGISAIQRMLNIENGLLTIGYDSFYATVSHHSVSCTISEIIPRNYRTDHRR